jgi:hypothetical protein
MAIVINGSGSITGLSVGGLPDGTVDSDTLATATSSAIAANTAKVTNSAPSKSDVDSLGISASSITGALPAIDGSAVTGMGIMLQQVETSIGQSVNIDVDGSVLAIDSGLDTNITVKRAGSSMRIWFHPSTENDTDITMDLTTFARIYNGGTLVATTISVALAWRDNDVNAGTIIFNSLAHGLSVGTVLTAKVYVVAGTANAGNIHFGQFGDIYVRVEEIA